MNRRQLIVGAGIAVATAAAARASAETPAMKPAASTTGLVTAASQCSRMAQACLRHCLALLATGSSSMGPCSKAVIDLIPAVDALAALAAGNSRHLHAFARVVAEIAKDCKAECDKHPMMDSCKACGDSCGALILEVARVRSGPDSADAAEGNPWEQLLLDP